MKMVQSENGQIIQYNLPKVGTLKDGRTVSGYHLLDEDTLRDEGWLHLEDIQPEYDTETQYLIHDGYEILVDKVVKKYRVANTEIIESFPTIEERVVTIEEIIDIIVGGK